MKEFLAGSRSKRLVPGLLGGIFIEEFGRQDKQLIREDVVVNLYISIRYNYVCTYTVHKLYYLYSLYANVTMKSQSHTRDERLDLRISADIKSLFARAAESTGMTMSAFVIEAARERAAKLIEQQDRIILNNGARDLLLDALANPAQPAKALTRAAKKYASQ